jgi:hypothetical protein
MLKKLVVAATIALSFTAAADPILLPGGVSVPNPVEANPVNGTGNVSTTLNFVQYVQNSSGDIISLEDELNADFNNLIGLTLNGFGILATGTDGDFLCPSCSLAFEFGGLEVTTDSFTFPVIGDVDGLGLDVADSFFNLYIIDEYTGSLGNDFVEPDRMSLSASADGFIDPLTDTLFLSGIFSELEYSPRLSDQNLEYGGLLDGELVAGIDIAEAADDEGIANGNIISNGVTQAGLTSFFDAVAFSLSSTFIGTTGEVITVAQGNAGNLSTNVQSVSAPATLGVFGLALAGMGLLRRRK